ncbi:RagB/SusD family nutrient uptake outer membrane protein [Arenibacter palladensis]|uniref:RagB/SusD family nutrient uptake outer membrane protein n=1 Tax=Arenibacter palladensis TaxID=237373 RepID=UPI002FD31A8F
MKNKFLLIASIAILFGCSDNLDLYPTTQFTQGSFYQNEEQMEQAVNEIYHQLGSIYGPTGLPSLFGTLRSDNAHIITTAAGSNYLDQIDNFTITSNNGHVENAWENSYKAIDICNNILYQLESTTLDIDSSKLNMMKGQTLSIRALIYFNMVRVWGAVPYIDKKITPNESFDYLRVPPGEIYKNLIEDLNFAKDNLPEAYTGKDIGRVTKYGAAAILAKLYLTIQNLPAAQNELENIIDSGYYSLDANNDGVVDVDDYLFLFLPDTKNSKSSILEVQYLSGENAFNSSHQNAYAPWDFNFHLPGQTRTFRGVGLNTPTKDLEEEFEDNDPRKEVSIYPGYTNLKTGDFVEYPFTMKFYDPDFENAGQNIEIIRYADILLMYAEVTGNPDYLNMVRARVDLPLYGSSAYPSDKYSTLLSAIYHERRLELCFEFHRFFDLVRQERAIEVMASQGYNLTEDQLLFPIPLNEIDINPDLTQNEGY